jgi:hypothetical protein
MVAGLFALGLFASLSKTSREAADSSVCLGRLTCIGIAMHDYEAKYGHFPPAFVRGADGKPAHSWRVLLLEFLDKAAFEAYKFSEPWDSPNNRRLESRMPSCYSCPSADGKDSQWRTSFFVVVGAGTVFPGDSTVTFEEIRRPKGQTIMVVESIHRNIHWMEPTDLTFESMRFELDASVTTELSSGHRDGPAVCMVDVSKRRLSGMNPAVFRQMFLIHPVGPD